MGLHSKKFLKKLDDLEESLPDYSIPLIDFLRNTSKLHKMCVEENLREDYKQVLGEFKNSFELCYELFNMNMTLKLHVIIHHYEDFFRMTGKTMKMINGEHHEAIHHQIKDFERTRVFFMRKNLGSLIHMEKSLKSISTFNGLRVGFITKENLRIRKSSLSEDSNQKSSPFSTPEKRFNHSNSFVLSTIVE